MTDGVDLTRAGARRGVALVGALRERITELDEQVADLERELAGQYAALSQRQVIAQAMGVLMCAGACSADKALMLLAERARQEDRTLHEVAAGLLAAHTESLLHH